MGLNNEMRETEVSDDESKENKERKETESQEENSSVMEAREGEKNKTSNKMKIDRWKLMKSELMYWFCCAIRAPD